MFILIFYFIICVDLYGCLGWIKCVVYREDLYILKCKFLLFISNEFVNLGRYKVDIYYLDWDKIFVYFFNI